MKKALEAWRELQRLRDDPVAALQVSNGKLIMELHKIIYESISPKLSVSPNTEEKEQKLPYWEIPHKKLTSLSGFKYGYCKYTIGGLIINIPLEVRAIVTDLTAVIYGAELLKFGERAKKIFQYDKQKSYIWKQTQEIDLIREMVSEFKQDNIMVLAMGKLNNEDIVLGSIGAIHGAGDRSVIDTIGFDGLSDYFNSPSTLPTNYSLYFRVTEEAKRLLTKDSKIVREASLGNN